MSELFLGDFVHYDRTYTVIEADYLIKGMEELTDSDDIISAAKHAAIQRMSYASPPDNLAANSKLLRGDYTIATDPLEYEGIVLIFDANNLAHRCRHVFNLSYKQYDVSVTYGFLSVMAATVRRFQNVKSIIVCWDGGVPAYRYDCVPTYKKSNHDDDESYKEFISQIIELQELLPRLGVYSLRKSKCEADDLIYHTARLIHPDFMKIIVSTDHDLLQCIDRDTNVWSPTKEQLIGKLLFKKDVGVTLEDFLVYRCLVGDSSDGIPGCKGIGDKTALKLIEDYGASPSNMINAAIGANPEAKPMTTALAGMLINYGLKGFADTMTAIRLDIDRCGCKGYLVEALRQELTYNHLDVQSYLKRYAFVSLIDPAFYNCFKALDRPRLKDNERYPRVLARERAPVNP